MTPSKEDRERGRETTPRVAESTPQLYPSGDYSYVLEIVMKMQDTMGQLKEAVASLKEQSKMQGDKLDQVRQDVHAAKVSMRVVGGIVAGFLVFLGWVIYEILPVVQTFLQKH